LNGQTIDCNKAILLYVDLCASDAGYVMIEAYRDCSEYNNMFQIELDSSWRDGQGLRVVPTSRCLWADNITVRSIQPADRST